MNTNLNTPKDNPNPRENDLKKVIRINKRYLNLPVSLNTARKIGSCKMISNNSKIKNTFLNKADVRTNGADKRTRTASIGCR